MTCDVDRTRLSLLFSLVHTMEGCGLPLDVQVKEACPETFTTLLVLSTCTEGSSVCVCVCVCV